MVSVYTITVIQILFAEKLRKNSRRVLNISIKGSKKWRKGSTV
jgi:hypothetical protein